MQIAEDRNLHQDSLEILHTGDIVLLKVSLSKDPYGEAGQGEDDTGYVTADGIRGEVNIVCCDSVEGTGLDVREYLFVVVHQLSYIAQRDLARRRKHLVDKETGQLSSGAQAQLQTYEAQAQGEAQQNDEVRRSQRRPLYYGDTVQLMHLRTQRFVGVRSKIPAPLQRTSRRIDLQKGNTSSFVRLDPYFSHKIQGQPIAIGEQVRLNCVKLGSDWCFNWHTVENSSKNLVREVNCAPRGRGFYFMLYSRTVPMSLGSEKLALSFGLTICMFHPHSQGHISASCAPHKRKPYLKCQDMTRQNNVKFSKAVWVIEHVTHELKDQGIMWLQTPVYLRHFASGRYLAVGDEDFKQGGLPGSPSAGAEGSSVQPVQSPPARRPSFKSRSSLGGPKEALHKEVELVDLPGPNCVFTFETTSILKVGDPGEKNFVPREAQTCLMLRWEKLSDQQPFWLSCGGTSKGNRNSLELFWSSVRYSRDAVRLDVVSDDPWMVECDVVAEHATKLRRSIIPRVCEFGDPQVCTAICGVTEHMISDMIFFLAGSNNFRTVDISELKQPNALDEVWVAIDERQQLARELKYIDSTFELFTEFVKQTPSLSGGDATYASRADALGSNRVNNTAAVTEAAHQMKTRCLKLLVRLWVFCFLGNSENEEYFFKNGWMDTLNNLNGHGLGASSVFVSLVSDNPTLIRAVDTTTMQKFITFIRQLGPLDTWLQFLAALCAPHGVAMFLKQQAVLCSLFFAGLRSADSDQNLAKQNHEDLLVAVRLGEPLDHYLGPPPAGELPPPLEQCMSPSLLTEGICDIVIAWTHPDEWVVGESVLYHGPEALEVPLVSTPRGESEGKSWVSLAHVVWVLQPDSCCERVVGISWEEAKLRDGLQPGSQTVSTARERYEDDRHKRSSQWNFQPALTRMGTIAHQGNSQLEGSRIEHLKVLAKFFLAQLQLICNMVKERQMNCVMALQQEYSFALCLSGVSDDRLPTSIRAAFMDILLAIWVDRHPHFQVVVPSLMRHLPDLQDNRLDTLPTFCLTHEELPDCWSQDHLRSLVDDVKAFYRLENPQKMEALLRVLRQYICDGVKVEQQVHSALDDNLLTNSMLRVLSYVIRFGFVYSKAIVMELMGPLLRMLDGRTDLLAPVSPINARNSLAQSGTRTPGVESAPSATFQFDIPEPIVPLLMKSEVEMSDMPPPRGKHEFTLENFPPHEHSALRYVAAGDNLAIHRSKVLLLSGILQLLQARDHIRISHILHKARDFIDENNPLSTPDALVDSILQVLDDPVVDLKQVRINQPDVMCVDLMMYEDPQIFSLALKLLFHHYMQTEDALKLLEKITILSPRQLELFNQLKIDVATLGKLIYSFENWGVDDQFSTIDNQKFQLLQRISLKIRNLCHLGDANTRPAEVQHMLRETELWTHISYVLGLNPIDFMPSCQGLLARVIALMCSVAAQFVSGNVDNQVLGFKELSLISKLLATHPDSALLVAEIFRNNANLCGQVTNNLVMQFGTLIARERQQGKFGPWYLSFFRIISTAGHNPVPQNQAMILGELMRIGPHTALHLLQTEKGMQHISRLAQGFRSVGQLQNPEVSRGTTGDDAELIYYIRSVELVGALAHGFGGQQSLVSKPFASSLFPAEMAFRLLLNVGSRSEARTDSQFSVHRYLRIRWLQLAQAVAYDVDKSLINVDVLIGSTHLEFFSRLLHWVEEVLQLSTMIPDFGTPRSNVNGRAAPIVLDEDEEEYLHAMLYCVDSFFSHCYTSILQAGCSEELVKTSNEYARRLGPILKASSHSISHATLRDSDVLYHTVHTIVSTINHPGKEVRRRLSTDNAKTAPVVHTPGIQVQWKTVFEQLQQDSRVQNRIKKEKEQLGSLFANIPQLTDPELPEYLRQMPQVPGGMLPDGTDFRRGQITTEDILKRMVRYITNRVHTDLEGTRSIEGVLLVMIQLARESDVEAALQRCHDQFVSSGITDLIIRILDANPSDEITSMAWQLLSETLLKYDQGVNNEVQRAIYKTCLSGDDSGMWETFTQFVTEVSDYSKTTRPMKLVQSMSVDEEAIMKEYEESISHAMKAMEAVRLTVENHYFPMQQYLFRQTGNARSYNVLEVTALLFIKMCKDQYAVDMLWSFEMDCVFCNLCLLIEMTQGPNVRNQEHLSTLGLVEAVFKLLTSNFERFRRTVNDVYPPKVRTLKARSVQCLLSLLEGRLDTKIQHAMLQRSDASILRERLEFVYVYFVCGAFDVGKGKTKTASATNAAIPLGSETAALVSNRSNPTKIYDHLKTATQVAEELLEDLEDLELDELFSEGLDVLSLIFQLCPHSNEFANKVMPLDRENETFKGGKEFYVTEREWKRERKEYHAREIYRCSFDFLSRFVKTIEVMLDGKLQHLHFQRPLTEMWYVHGQAKNHILNSVDPLGSSDTKMKAFIAMCQKTHSESKLVRLLSRYSIMPSEQWAKWAQRTLWDGLHRPFQTFFKDDAKNMQRSLSIQLVLGLVLSLHTGAFLVPVAHADSYTHNTVPADRLVWSSPLMERISFSMGVLYTGVVTIWLIVTACLKAPLRYEDCEAEEPHRARWRLAFKALWQTLTGPSIAWRIVLLGATTCCLVFKQYWLYSFLVADFFCQNSSLGSVLEAIVNKGYSLSMTFLGACIISYVYAGFGYHHFREDFNQHCSENILYCAVNIIYQGTRNGIIGLSSMLDAVHPHDEKFPLRFVYDITYFVVYGIMLLNTIVALIVDSFSALRTLTEARDHINETQTFISCIDRKVIETVAQAQGIADGWEHHEQRKQNKWDYMAFIFHLREKDTQEYTGPEQAIRHMIENKDVKWLPIGRSMMLEADEEHGAKEDILVRIEKSTGQMMAMAQSAKEHRVIMTRVLSTLRAHVDDRFDTVDEELTQIHSGVQKRRHDATTANLAIIQAQRAGAIGEAGLNMTARSSM